MEPTNEGVRFVQAEPGDGTRYTAAIVPWKMGPYVSLGECGTVSDGWLVVCGLNGKAHLLQADGYLHWSYVAEKFDLREHQARQFTKLLQDVLGRPGTETLPGVFPLARPGEDS